MPFQRPLVFVLLLSTLLLGSCTGYQKLLKSDDVNKKYTAAIQYYEKGDYARASTLLEELIPLLKGRPEAEKAEFYFANTNFQGRNYTLSAYYFQQFAETYGSSPQVEEARFMHAKSLFRDSPEFELDQSNTYTAIEAIQEFLNQYPESQFRPEAENMSKELQTKLENKAFESARLYYQLRYNQAAVVAFNTFQQQYPSSAYSEQAAFMKLTAQYEYAKESVEEKQRERYLEAIAFYQNFIDAYPQSKDLKAAEAMYNVARAEVAKLKPADTAATK
ncbi:outer membrane protein assembly factor BamD [Hymenobacter lutimineralis]|uniref:Outer membrane protein assembly factor BamD n=1 Tax=Hymenobacter lutimineralis TaxID=2606448 RepID=A0A5D6VAF0_9BACT|nr:MULTISPECIES: outer membrane protein assembly factor BamD [Hymenobacter]QIX62550.1 outer membrane protein assembly factor BamD [Hymenobacter sp. BT18]TYZ11888.1 outer membrane protein assembly factor BamD [Hymenobacter lutimineralis]